jgi:hypothetical protein
MSSKFNICTQTRTHGDMTGENDVTADANLRSNTRTDSFSSSPMLSMPISRLLPTTSCPDTLPAPCSSTSAARKQRRSERAKQVESYKSGLHGKQQLTTQITARVQNTTYSTTGRGGKYCRNQRRTFQRGDVASFVRGECRIQLRVAHNDHVLQQAFFLLGNDPIITQVGCGAQPATDAGTTRPLAFECRVHDNSTYFTPDSKPCCPVCPRFLVLPVAVRRIRPRFHHRLDSSCQRTPSRTSSWHASLRRRRSFPWPQSTTSRWSTLLLCSRRRGR